MTPSHDWLSELLHHLGHVLPAQAPIKDFVHHNTLHGFQNLPFREALAAAEASTGNQGYQTPKAFRAYFQQGRVDLSDLDAALDETPELRADESLPVGLTRRDVLRVGLLHDLTPPPPAVLDWRLAETDVLRRLQAGVSQEARRRLGEGSEAEILQALWAACLELASLHGWGEAAPSPFKGEVGRGMGLDASAAHPIPSPALPLKGREQAIAHDAAGSIKAAAERRLAELADRFGHDLTLRGLLLQFTGRDVLDDLRPYLARHLASHIDLGLAAWHNPARDQGLYAAWLQSARLDPHFELTGLPGWEQVLERLPENAKDCIVQELHVLGVTDERRAGYLEALAKELPGWSGMILWRHEHPGYEDETTPIDMADYLALRLVLERIHGQRLASAHFKTEATLPGLRGYFHHHPAELLVRLALFTSSLPEWLQDQGHRLVREAVNRGSEENEEDWLPAATMLARAHPDAAARRSPWTLFLLAQRLGLDARALRQPGLADALFAVLDDLTPERMGWVWLQAYERHYRQQILGALAANVGRGPWKTRDARPSAQLMLCMDDREEGLRRHLEELAPDLETLGAAAHFNVPHAWKALDEDKAVPLAPVVPSVVVPAHEVRERACDASLGMVHAERTSRRLGWKEMWMQGSRLGLLRPALLTAAAAPFILPALAGKAFAPGAWGRFTQSLRTGFDQQVDTRIDFVAANNSPEARPEARRVGFTDVEQADRVQLLLRNTGLTHGYAPLVVIMGHASHSLNNPHGSAYNCGACAGRWSGPNARLVAAMANRPETRAILKERGIDIPADAWFVGAEHDTCDDIVTWLDEFLVPDSHRPALARLKDQVNEACKLHAQERCRRLMSAPLDISAEAAWKHVTGRANDYSQARPELGHATNACAFFGRRSISRGAFFDRRAFLISYDPSQDPDGAVLERHLVINGAVGAGISLEYYFSSANNERYGCGTKVMHNVAGNIGVMEGASSDLRTGLPRQMIEVHEAMRLLVVVEHKLDVLTAIYQRQPAVAELVGNAWVQLAAIDPDSGEIHRFVLGQGWVKWQGDSRLPLVQRSSDWALGKREPLPPALIASCVARASSPAITA